MRVELQGVERIGVALDPLVVKTVNVLCLGQLGRFPVVIAMGYGIEIVGFVTIQVIKLKLETVVHPKDRNRILIVLYKGYRFDVIRRIDFFFLCKGLACRKIDGKQDYKVKFFRHYGIELISKSKDSKITITTFW